LSILDFHWLHCSEIQHICFGYPNAIRTFHQNFPVCLECLQTVIPAAAAVTATTGVFISA